MTVKTDRLIDVVVEEASAEARREHDRAVNATRDHVRDAEDHVAELKRAAKDLGAVRGAAAEASLQREADTEILGVYAAAFDRLVERFRRRLLLALEALPGDAAYGDALGAWSRAAIAAMTGPTEIAASPQHGEAVYDALCAAGARDFRVQPDRSVTTGFVVRDMDGRTLFDARPAALVAARSDALEDLLRARVPPPPTGIADDEERGRATEGPGSEAGRD